MSRRTLVRSGNTVDAEVANLFKLHNKSQFTNTLLHLRQRYRDEDLVNQIQDVFMEKHSQIVKSAKKFATAIRNKYANQNVPFHQLLMKARLHANKYGLTSDEFNEFQRIYEQELAGSGSNEVIIPMTSIMKVLGDITTGADAYFSSNEADYRNLQEILKLHDMSRPLHAQTLLQAIGFEGLYAPSDDPSVAGASNLVMTQAVFDRKIHNPAEHVHPVIAALFMHKFKSIEEHFLFSNMSGIIKSRYNRQPLTTRPDYELFYNLVTDPNDVVCDTRTPIADLLHRCNLQNQLWNSVLHLRNGQIYNQSLREFTSSVDVCRLNKYDNPDFVYGRHDGTILKRLFSAFSYRPTIVATMSVNSLFPYNPYSQNIRPIVTSIPMINIRLNNFVTNKTFTLKDALNQPTTYIEGNAMVDRFTSVLYSRELLVFYIDRRSTSLVTNNTLTNIARLPTSVAGFERINQIQFDFDDYIIIETNKEKFYLASAVVSEVNSEIEPPNNYVIGSSTILFNYKGNLSNPLIYSPGTVTTRNKDLPKEPIYSKTGDKAMTEAFDLIRKNGIILIYAKRNYEDKEGVIPI